MELFPCHSRFKPSLKDMGLADFEAMRIITALRPWLEVTEWKRKLE